MSKKRVALVAFALMLLVVIITALLSSPQASQSASGNTPTPFGPVTRRPGPTEPGNTPPPMRDIAPNIPASEKREVIVHRANGTTEIFLVPGGNLDLIKQFVGPCDQVQPVYYSRPPISPTPYPPGVPSPTQPGARITPRITFPAPPTARPGEK